MSIPQEPEKRQKFFKLVEQGVAIKNEQDTLKEDLANLGDISNDEFGIPKSEFNKYVTTMYDLNKANEKLEELQTVISEVEIMKG